MNCNQIDVSKSLKQLTSVNYGPAPTGATGLIRKVHELRELPLHLWTNEDLRLVILQKMHLDYLMPLALRRLAHNPFSSGDVYTGDLLNAVISAGHDFWSEHPDWHYELDSIIDSLKVDIDSYTTIIEKYTYSWKLNEKET